MKERFWAFCDLTWKFYFLEWVNLVQLNLRTILPVSTVWNTVETGDINFKFLPKKSGWLVQATTIMLSSQLSMLSSQGRLKLFGESFPINHSAESENLGLWRNNKILVVANCVTLSTRIQTDILRAATIKNTRKGSMELYLAQFSSRPVLHVKEVNKTPYALTFADAIKRYGASLEE